MIDFENQVRNEVIKDLALGMIRKIVERKLLSEDVLHALFEEVKAENLKRAQNTLSKILGDL